MASLSELQSVRLDKIQTLADNSMPAFAYSVPKTHNLEQIVEQYDNLYSSQEIISTTGRIVAIRGQGAILFVVLREQSTQFQCVFKRDILGDNLHTLFFDTADIGDFISVTGNVFETQRGEKSLQVQSWIMATKSLLPLPDKWNGLKDIEEKYRKRYLDIAIDDELYNRFVLRSKIITYIRRFFDDKNFLEIETPILQNQAGGAMAKTFNTYHEDYSMNMVLRISLELEHKMVMVGGFPGVYEIGKNFRNEGSDPTHIQEFTMIEWYAAYKTLRDNMDWTEELIRGIATNIIGRTTFTVFDKQGNEQQIDMAGAWPHIRFDDMLLQYSGISVANSEMLDIQNKCIELGMSADESIKTGRGNLLDFIFKKTCRSTIINPTFVTNYPAELKPLAQQNDDGTASVAQLVIAGSEITNQYAELVNPIVQRELLVQQSVARENGDDEAMEIDERFLTAMEHGMPPMTGFGMGIDRLVSIFTEQFNLRDTILFPIMRPEHID